jgi:hypothetical protein
LKVDHQGEMNTLNITISYRYVANIKETDYPDFRVTWLTSFRTALLN